MRNIIGLSKQKWFQAATVKERYTWLMIILELADDQGRFEMNVRNLRTTVFCADANIKDDDIEAVINSLVIKGKLLLYKPEDQEYCQIVDWWKTQAKAQWMKPSEFPAAPGWRDAWRVTIAKNVQDTSLNWKTKKTEAGLITLNQVMSSISAQVNVPIS